MENARLFLAIDLDDATLNALTSAVEGMRAFFPGARWCRRRAMHLTLRFFGTIPLKSVARIAKAVQPVAASREPVSFEVKGLGAFPTMENPRVLWTGVSEGRLGIELLASDISAALEKKGFGAGERRFVPHITLARFKRRTKPRQEYVEEALAEFGSASFGVTEAERVVLYASELTQSGPLYTVVDEWPVG